MNDSAVSPQGQLAAFGLQGFGRMQYWQLVGGNATGRGFRMHNAAVAVLILLLAT